MYPIVCQGISMIRGWLCKCWCILRALCAPECAPNWRLQRTAAEASLPEAAGPQRASLEGCKSAILRARSSTETLYRIASAKLPLSVCDREPRLGSAAKSLDSVLPFFIATAAPESVRR